MAQVFPLQNQAVLQGGCFHGGASLKVELGVPTPLCFKPGCLQFLRSFAPKGPKIEKNQDLDIFKRDWKFQASHPPNPYFLRGILKAGIEIFKRDWKFQARLIFFKIRALRGGLVFALFCAHLRTCICADLRVSANNHV